MKYRLMILDVLQGLLDALKLMWLFSLSCRFSLYCNYDDYIDVADSFGGIELGYVHMFMYRQKEKPYGIIPIEPVILLFCCHIVSESDQSIKDRKHYSAPKSQKLVRRD